MAARKVTDEDGRVWECKAEAESTAPGRDIHLVCTTAGLSPLRVKVSWQWAKMADKGLARLIAAAIPAPA